MRLLLSAVLVLAPACVAKPGREASQPVAEPIAAEPVVFVEALPDPARPTQPAASEPVAETPSEDRREQAKLAFQDGVQRYEAGDIAGAVDKFREAYLLAPLPALLFNIARGQEQLGDIVGACASYRAASADPLADDAMRQAATERIAQLSCP